MAYVAGKPIMTDAEFDELKMRLKVFFFVFFRSLLWFFLNEKRDHTVQLKLRQVIFNYFFILKSCSKVDDCCGTQM